MDPRIHAKMSWICNTGHKTNFYLFFLNSPEVHNRPGLVYVLQGGGAADRGCTAGGGDQAGRRRVRLLGGRQAGGCGSGHFFRLIR